MKKIDKLREILSSELNSIYLIESIRYMYENNTPLTIAALWEKIDNELLKFITNKTPKSTLSRFIERNRKDSNSKKTKETNYFLMIENSKPHQFILEPGFRNKIDKLVKEIKESEEMVYGIKEEGTDFYKIGRTISEKRITRIQTGNPRKLKYVFQISGGKEFEKWLHEKIFKSYRQEGEWFDLKEENFLHAVIPILKKLFELEKILEKNN